MKENRPREEYRALLSREVNNIKPIILSIKELELKPASTTGQAAYKDGDNPNRRRTASGPHAKALDG